MPEAPRASGGRLRRLLREWPLLGAALALGSLAFLPFWFPSRARTEAAALEALRGDPGPAADFEAKARAFLDRRPSPPAAAEAHLLAGRALLARLRAGDPGADARLAASHAAAARSLGRAEARDLQRDLARALLDLGTPAEAVAALREIHAADREAAGDLARALAAQAAVEPARADSLLAEAFERVPRPPDQAELCLLAGKPDRALKILESAPLEPGADPGPILLARARALAVLGRFAEALAALDLAAEKLPGPMHADRLALARVELLARAGDPDAVDAALAMDRARLPSAPRARLLAAAGRGASRDVAAALAALAEFPSVDPAWIRARLLAAVERAATAAELEDAEAALLQLARLRPADPAPLLAAARAALLRARRAPDPAAARLAAGDRFERAARSGRLAPDDADRALLDGAAAFAAAERPERAAALYRRAYESSPRRLAEHLLRQADALRRAGLHLRGADGRPGALDVYSDYLDRAEAGDPGVPAALLGRAAVLEGLGRFEGALADLDRVRSDALGLAPSSADWEASLLARGRVLLAHGRPLDAALSLEEHLERYAAEGDPRESAVEAAWLLSKSRLALGAPDLALDALARIADLPAKDERARALQRDARFLRGELLLARGRFEEAERAFSEGLRARAGDPERLWGLAGRARALSRLGRADEARRLADAGRALYEEQRPLYDAAFAGRARAWWESIAEELR